MYSLERVRLHIRVWRQNLTFLTNSRLIMPPHVVPHIVSNVFEDRFVINDLLKYNLKYFKIVFHKLKYFLKTLFNHSKKVRHGNILATGEHSR